MLACACGGIFEFAIVSTVLGAIFGFWRWMRGKSQPCHDHQEV